MSKSRQKGTAAESAVVKFLRDHGWPNAERRALAGALDKGDVLIPALMLEVKSQRSYKLPEWMRETAQQKENSNADYGILIIKPNGVGSTQEKVAQWWAVLTLQELTDLLRDAGYGDPK